jgi:hypothetical protein
MNTVKPLARHLITDEEVTVTDKFGTEVKLRVRIWQGRNATPVVLASPAVNDDGERYSPYCVTCKLANYVLGAMLGHPTNMMLYFEDQVLGDGSNVLEQVYFEFYGQAHRLKMYKPERRTIEWEQLEHTLEGLIER